MTADKDGWLLIRNISHFQKPDEATVCLNGFAGAQQLLSLEKNILDCMCVL